LWDNHLSIRLASAGRSIVMLFVCRVERDLSGKSWHVHKLPPIFQV
jgi:hypothetical protein